MALDRKGIGGPPENIYLADLDALRHWERNYNRGDVEAIKNSILEFGFNGVLKVWRDNVVMAGNHSLIALKEIRAAGTPAPRGVMLNPLDSAWLIPCTDLSHLTWMQAEAFAIADNRSAQLAHQDEKALAQVLKDVAAQNTAMLKTIGYSQAQLDAMLKDAQRQANIAADSVRGKTPEQKLDTYLNNTIKQIVLYFSGAEYDGVVDRLDVVMQREGVESHTDAFLKLLEAYERANNLDGWQGDGAEVGKYDE